MIALMKRILSVSGPYQGRIKLAFVFAFLKAMLSKAPIGLSFLALSAFLQGTMTARLCLWLAVGTVGCVLLECLCQNIADRLQAAAGYMVFADLRMELGRHLRRLPMGYFTEGNIGKISSVLSTDMVFIEENCMHDIANMMSFAAALGDENRQHLMLEMMRMEHCGGTRVGAITEKTNLSRPAVSHHIQILKEAGILKMRREGTKNYYYFDANFEAMNRLIQMLEHARSIMERLPDRSGIK